MRKKVLFAILFLFLMLNLSFVLAEETTEEDLSELVKVEKAYHCLEDKIEEQTCEDLSTEEKIFTLKPYCKTITTRKTPQRTINVIAKGKFIFFFIILRLSLS